MSSTKLVPHGDSVVVLLSGGQDSATCLAAAQSVFKTIRAIAFQYGQRHATEIESARALANEAGVPLEVFTLPVLSQMTDNALMSDQPILQQAGQLPNTFVDGRNMVFLLYAAIYAKQFDCHDILTGVCQTDYSGYPDCRESFVNSAQETLSLAMDYPFRLHTPLMHLTKKETVLWMKEMGKLDWYAKTHTCYKGQKPPCGECPACELRAKGFLDAGEVDPLVAAS